MENNLRTICITESLSEHLKPTHYKSTIQSKKINENMQKGHKKQLDDNSENFWALQEIKTAVDFTILNKSESTHLCNTNRHICAYICIYVFIYTHYMCIYAHLCIYTHTLMEEEGRVFNCLLFFSKTLILLINVELMKELFIHYFTRTLRAIDLEEKSAKGVKFLLWTTKSIFLSIT